MSKFNIGDLVKIGTVIGSVHCVSSMYKFEGQVGRIIDRHRDFQYLVKIEGTDGWWFDENILTPYIDNRRFIDAFLGGKEVEALSDTGKWLRLCAITPEIAQLKMRFAKSEEVEVIEKEIESFRAKIETLEKQKKDIDLKIKYAKVRISRREKKLKTLS
jgi:hypothetical protein